ncbi:MAG: hypothetical protein IJG17_08170 [Eubacterium sp.]|nr:hypothetical protein [Eubacterium sp.]
MKRIMAIVLCGMLLAGCGSAGGAAAASSTAAASSAESAASSAAVSEAESTSENETAASSEQKDAALKEGYEEQEFCGIHYLADPAWEVEVSDKKDLCHLNTPNENVFFVLGHVSKSTIVSNDTDDGIYQSLEVFTGENDQNMERLKFANGTHYISFFSDYETDHGYNSIFYTKEGLFAFGLQIIGEIDETEEKEYADTYRMMLETLEFEKPEYEAMK